MDKKLEIILKILKWLVALISSYLAGVNNLLNF